MPIRVVCPNCKSKISAPDKYVGKKVGCPKCKSPVKIPSIAIATTPPPESSARPIAGELLDADLDRLFPPPSAMPSRPLAPAQDTKACAFCGEQILAAAVKCRFCGELLDPILRAAAEPRVIIAAAPVQQPAPTIVISNQATVKTRGGLGCGGAIVLFLALGTIAVMVKGCNETVHESSPAKHVPFNPHEIGPAVHPEIDYLRQLDEVAWVVIDGNTAFIGFKSGSRQDRSVIVRGAAYQASKTQDLSFHVFGMNEDQVGLVPGGDFHYRESATARRGKITEHTP
jgi:hypothetical protein